MLFPALGMTAAMWLLTGPLLGVETGGRAMLTASVGLLALLLSLLSFWNRRAGWAVALLGVVLGFANLFMWAPISAYASLATAAVCLVAAGAAPQPVVVAAAEAAQPAPVASPGTTDDEHYPVAA